MMIYGYCNCAYYNLRPEGDHVWFQTHQERDAALDALRERARANGLGETACEAGIYPIKRRIKTESDEVWLEALQDAPSPGERWGDRG